MQIVIYSILQHVLQYGSAVLQCMLFAVNLDIFYTMCCYMDVGKPPEKTKKKTEKEKEDEGYW